MIEGPFVVSHTGIQALCKDGECLFDRNLNDQQIAVIADHGGVIGVGFWPDAVGCGAERIVRAMQEIRDQLDECRALACPRVQRGEYYIAFGSDFDGAVMAPLAANHMPALVARLETSGSFNREAVDRISGLNACFVIASVLPEGGPDRANEICGAVASRALGE